MNTYAIIDESCCVLDVWHDERDAGVLALISEAEARINATGGHSWVFVDDDQCQVGDLLVVDDDGCAEVVQ